MSLIVTPGANGTLTTTYVPSAPSSYTYWYRTDDGVDIEVTAHTSNAARAETVRTDVAQHMGWAEQEAPNSDVPAVAGAFIFSLFLTVLGVLGYVGAAIIFRFEIMDGHAFLRYALIGFVAMWVGLSVVFAVTSARNTA